MKNTLISILEKDIWSRNEMGIIYLIYTLSIVTIQNLHEMKMCTYCVLSSAHNTM